MTLRGEAATAAALRVMLDEERKHLDAVAHWAASIGQSLPSGDTFKRSVPADLWKAWDEAAGSAQLTPYRAFGSPPTATKSLRSLQLHRRRSDRPRNSRTGRTTRTRRAAPRLADAAFSPPGLASRAARHQGGAGERGLGRRTACLARPARGRHSCAP
jgi:hypothetical protein